MMGGGFGLLILATFFIFLAERRWVRIACGVYVGLFIAFIVTEVALGAAPVEMLAFPLIIVSVAMIASEVAKMVGKW